MFYCNKKPSFKGRPSCFARTKIQDKKNMNGIDEKCQPLSDDKREEATIGIALNANHKGISSFSDPPSLTLS